MADESSAFRYLLDCLAARPLPDPPADADWDALYSLLVRHRLAARFHALIKPRQARWPESFRERLRLFRAAQGMYGEQCGLRVRQSLAALKDARVSVIVLKGWAYIQTIYGGDASQRLCEDVDLLVHPRRVDAAAAALARLGCEPERESWPGYHRRYTNGERLFFPSRPGNPANTFSIGLHWGLIHIPSYDARRVDMDKLFARTRPLNVAGVDALELGAEDEVVYACAHWGLHHRFDPALFRYYEIAAQIARAGESLRWEVAAARAREWRLTIPVREGLERVERLWPGTVPRSAREALAGLSPARGERFVHAWNGLTVKYPALAHLLTWLTFPDWRQRPLIALQDVFPSRAYMEWRYGRAPFGFWPWLYARRFLRALPCFRERS